METYFGNNSLMLCNIILVNETPGQISASFHTRTTANKLMIPITGTISVALYHPFIILFVFSRQKQHCPVVLQEQ